MAAKQKVTRKLRAILSADVKGYSLLMTNDEASTIKTLKKYRKILKDLDLNHFGKVTQMFLIIPGPLKREQRGHQIKFGLAGKLEKYLHGLFRSGNHQ